MLMTGTTGFTELIDTCWNVNPILYRPDRLESLELIDTCWNVNDKHIDFIERYNKN